MTEQGTPCWYELGTTDLNAAAAFYGQALGWTTTDSGMEGFTYHLATAADGGMVAGMMDLSAQEGAPPPNWTVYFTSDHADATVAAATAAGGSVLQPANDIPGTGRFAILADPQGAVFGILQPEPMEGGEPEHPAFDQQAEGHGNWHELMSSDPVAGYEFYAGLFGWTKGEAIDMGEMGKYQLFGRGEQMYGGMMGRGDAPQSTWMPYFGVDGASAAMERITSAGGSIHMGPQEVPGPAYIAIAIDPQGAWFAVVGPQE